MKITVSGDIGSGKSTVSKLLAKTLRLEYYSIGGFMRELALERGISLLALSKEAEKDKGATDHILDQKTQMLGRTRDNFLIEGRIAFLFIPDSFKLFLCCDLDEAARRIFLENRSNEKDNETLEKTRDNILVRKKSEQERYRAYYGIEFPPFERFDLVVDTTHLTPDQVVEKVLGKLKGSFIKDP